MKKLKYKKCCLFIVSLILFSAASGFGQTYITGGNVSGTWSSVGSPYYVQGEITIPNSETLSIEPGVDVIFMGHYKFNVQGRLLAVGTQQDSIHFTAENTGIGWHGIRFDSTLNTNDTSKMFFCLFKYGKASTGSYYDRCGGAILIQNFDKVLIYQCTFEFNLCDMYGAVIYVNQASPVITNNTFSKNSGNQHDGAIACIGYSEAIIKNNVFSFNHGQYSTVACVYSENNKLIISGNVFSYNSSNFGTGGIFLIGADVRIENNIITHNSGVCGGILCYMNCQAVIINNTIAYNIAKEGAGIYCLTGPDPILINNVIYGNVRIHGIKTSQVYISDPQSDPHFLYCNIEGGKEGFEGPGAGNNYTGLYVNNIDADPLFMNPSSDDYRLSDLSPCIGAGIDSVDVEGIWYKVPAFCIMDNPRPTPAGSMPDIGACESPLGAPVVGIEQEITFPEEFVLNQNFPNPFNPSTKIQYSVPQSSQVQIKIYDVLGNEIATLVNETKEAGKYNINFNASKLSSGVYFYTIKAGDFIQTKKMILLR
jgi:hypothetical protein